MATIERQLQQNLNKIENWATSNGFKFSKSKTQCVHFCQLRKQHDDPVLHLYGSPIPVVEESKFQSWGRLHANVIDYNYNYFEIS